MNKEKFDRMEGLSNEIAQNNIKYYASIVISDLIAEGFNEEESVNFIRELAQEQLNEEKEKLKC